MNAVNLLGIETASALATLALNTLIQSSLVITAGLLAVRILRRHGAAVQSAILRMTVLTVLACPFASWTLARAGFSGFAVELPSVDTSVSAPEAASAQTVAMASSWEEPSTDTERDRGLINEPSRLVAGTVEVAQHPKVPSDALLGEGTSHAPSALPSQVPSIDPEERFLADARPVGVAYLVVAVTWLAVALILLGRIVVANWIVSGLRTGGRAAGRETQALCRAAAAAMDVRAPLVRISSRIQSPCLMGVIQPAILLPASMDAVTRDVLVHELAHLRRRDCAWQFLSCIVTASFWFQPLAWLLSRHLEQTADDVADDFVVQFGSDRSEYARQLVDIAEQFQPEWSTACAGAGIVSLRSSLAKRIVRIMDTSRSPSTRASLVAVSAILLLGGTCTLGVGLLGIGRAHADPGDAVVDAERSSAASPEPDGAPAASAVQRHIRGVVQGPDGRPFAGADVFVGLGDWSGDSLDIRIAKSVALKSGPDGRFEVSIRPRDLFENPEAVPNMVWDYLSEGVYVAATAPDYGPAWNRGFESADGGPMVLRLVEDHPIEGRLLTLEGVPVGGAHVRLESIEAAPANDVEPWLSSLRGGKSLWEATESHKHDRITPNVFRLTSQFTTDDEGRFRIKGIGRDRVARLFAKGASVARTEFRVIARQTKPLPTNLDPYLGPDKVYGATFEPVVAPSQPIVGVVRDAATGSPLAQIAIESYRIGSSGAVGSRSNLLRVHTDEAGRFRLEGMPKGRGNRLLAVPDDDQAYFMREIPVPESEGLGPINVEVEMHRGIWITGSVIDLVTRKPLMASLHYLPFLSNEHAERLPEFQTNRSVEGGSGHQHRYQTRADGSFRLVGLPGRGVVGAEVMAKYRLGAGAERIAGANEDGVFPTYRSPLAASKSWPHVMVEVEPAVDAERVEVILEADPGSAVQVTVTDSTGKPVTGYQVSGEYATGMWSPSAAAPTFAVGGIGAAENRTVLIHHAERGIGKAIRVTGTESDVAVQLEACATVTGRIIDGDGDPMVQARLTPTTKPGQGSNAALPETSTDADGAFEFTNIVPGIEYRLRIVSRKPRIFQNDIVQFAPQAGETVDLGPVVVRPRTSLVNTSRVTPKEPAPNPPANAAGQRPAQFSGHVLDPAGKPVANASLYTLSRLRDPPLALTDVALKQAGRTNAAGQFQVSTNFRGFPNGVQDVPVYAHAAGYGVAWAKARPNGDADSLVLRLQEDHIVRGRLVDTEGRPVASATIAVIGLLQEANGSLDGFLEAWKNDWNIAATRSDRVFGNFATLLDAKSNAEGEFELRGIGRERVAFIEINHPQMARTRLWVVNRERFDGASYNSAALGRLPMELRRTGITPPPLLIGPNFSHVVESGRSIEGIVYTGKDRSPVVGATVKTVVGQDSAISTVTDDRGAYVLRGIPSHQLSFVMVTPDSNHALLSRSVSAKTPVGASTVTIDVELIRGVELAGRIVDPSNGKGVRASIRVVQLPDNEFIDQPKYDYKRARQVASTDADGNFRVITIPGPSVVMAQVSHRETMGGHDLTPFRLARFSAEDAKRVSLSTSGQDHYFPVAGGSVESLMVQNAVKYVDLNPTDKLAPIELRVERGKTIEVQVQDETGQPLSGVYAAGVTEHWPITFLLNESRCKVFGIGEDGPRKLLLLHPQRGLSASLALTGDEESPVIAKLSPTGSIAGRAFDDGAALDNVQVEVNFPNRTTSELYRFAKLKNARHLTDGEGRFRVDNLVPGERFSLSFREGEHYFRAKLPRTQRVAEGGKVRDYKNVQLRRVR